MRLLIAGIIIFFISFYFYLIWPRLSHKQQIRPFLHTMFAHRGYHCIEKGIPENSLSSFRAAISHGYGIELDVHTSADGELIVMHDETVDRVTDGTGLIKDMTLAQLKELKVSTSAEPTGIYRVPTLAEVLDLMRTTDMMVNIELKNSICFYPGMEEKILKLVKEMKMEEQLIYSSFNHYSLLQLKQLDNHVQTGILFSDGWVNPAMYAKNLGINAVHPAVYHLKYPQFMEEVKRAGLKMHVWTANKPEHIQLVKDAGAEAVITNYPDRAIEIVEK